MSRAGRRGGMGAADADLHFKAICIPLSHPPPAPPTLSLKCPTPELQLLNLPRTKTCSLLFGNRADLEDRKLWTETAALFPISGPSLPPTSRIKWCSWVQSRPGVLWNETACFPSAGPAYSTVGCRFFLFTKSDPLSHLFSILQGLAKSSVCWCCLAGLLSP